MICSKCHQILEANRIGKQRYCKKCNTENTKLYRIKKRFVIIDLDSNLYLQFVNLSTDIQTSWIQRFDKAMVFKIKPNKKFLYLLQKTNIGVIEIINQPKGEKNEN